MSGEFSNGEATGKGSQSCIALPQYIASGSWENTAVKVSHAEVEQLAISW